MHALTKLFTAGSVTVAAEAPYLPRMEPNPTISFELRDSSTDLPTEGVDSNGWKPLSRRNKCMSRSRESSREGLRTAALDPGYDQRARNFPATSMRAVSDTAVCGVSCVSGQAIESSFAITALVKNRLFAP